MVRVKDFHIAYHSLILEMKGNDMYYSELFKASKIYLNSYIIKFLYSFLPLLFRRAFFYSLNSFVANAWDIW